MGIVSIPLFTNHPDAKIKPSSLSPATLDYFNGMVDDDNLFKREEITLGEFMDSICYQIKLWGYFVKSTLMPWKEFLRVASESNEGRTIEFHFYCCDEQFPYYFSYNRGIAYYTEYSHQITLEDYCVRLDCKEDVPISSVQYKPVFSSDRGGDAADDNPPADSGDDDDGADDGADADDDVAEASASSSATSEPCPTYQPTLHQHRYLYSSYTDRARKTFSAEDGVIYCVDGDECQYNTYFVERLYREKYQDIYGSRTAIDSMPSARIDESHYNLLFHSFLRSL